jgi:hypothetical protein
MPKTLEQPETPCSRLVPFPRGASQDSQLTREELPEGRGGWLNSIKAKIVRSSNERILHYPIKSYHFTLNRVNDRQLRAVMVCGTFALLYFNKILFNKNKQRLLRGQCFIKNIRNFTSLHSFVQCPSTPSPLPSLVSILQLLAISLWLPDFCFQPLAFSLWPSAFDRQPLTFSLWPPVFGLQPLASSLRLKARGLRPETNR